MAQLAGLWYGPEPVIPTESTESPQMWPQKAMGSNAWGETGKLCQNCEQNESCFPFVANGGRDELPTTQKVEETANGHELTRNKLGRQKT
jgi:hypothetical protein